MNTAKNYTFLSVENCNMCGNPTNENKIMGLRMNKSQGLKPLSKRGICVTIIKCKKCSLVYSDPLPIPANIDDHYGIPPENYWVESYFKVNPNYFRFEISKVKELMAKNQDALRALDIGAGIGKCMISLKESGFDTYGIEPSDSFRRMAIEKMGIEEDRLQNKMIEDAQYPENYFDFITFGAVLEHLYNPSENLIKVHKWLKKGGIVHAEVPSSDWLIGKIYNTTYKIRTSDFISNLSPMHEPYHLYEFSLISFEKFAEKNGYIIAYYYRTAGQVYFLPKFTHKLLKKLMIKTGTGMQLCVFMQKI